MLRPVGSLGDGSYVMALLCQLKRRLIESNAWVIGPGWLASGLVRDADCRLTRLVRVGRRSRSLRGAPRRRRRSWRLKRPTTRLDREQRLGG